MKRRTIAYIGASYKFVHRTIRDFLITGVMDDTDIVLYDIDPDPLQIEFDLCRRMVRQMKSGITIHKATSRAQALEGADYVVTSLLVGGMDLAEKEDLICQKYGIRHTVGDTVGPMCTARCLRMVPLMLDIARDMERYCPNAWMLSVTNPMAVLTNAVNRHTRTRCIGICHGTHHRLEIIAEVYGVKVSDIHINVVGVNHLGFINRIHIKGVEHDVFKVARKITAAAKKGHDDIAGYQDTDVWGNIFARRYGILPNNADRHFIEFFRWFLTPAAFQDGKNIYGLDHTFHSPQARRDKKQWYRDITSRWAYGKKPVEDMDKPGGENLHSIILGLEGIHGDNPYCNRELHLNVTNHRAVPNLPPEANLELTCTLSAAGAQPAMNEPLSPFLQGILTPLACLNLLSEKAAVESDQRAFQEALTLDPLVSNFQTIPDLARELWAANKPFFKPVK